MKRNLIYMVLVTMLVACSRIAYSTQDSHGCFRDGGRELCVTIKAGKDVVQAGELLPLTITVTSSQDEQGLLLLLSTVVHPDLMKNINFPAQETTYEDTFNKGWEFDIKANQDATFNGSVSSFYIERGSISIIVSISDPYLGRLVSNSLEIVFHDNQGKIYYANTRIPFTPEIIEETAISYTRTPGPSPTWAPSATWYPHIETRVALTQQAEQKTPQP